MLSLPALSILVAVMLSHGMKTNNCWNCLQSKVFSHSDHPGKPRVIGISGSTRCGKSTLTKLLKDQCTGKAETCDLDRYAHPYLDVKEEQLTEPVRKMLSHDKFESGWIYEMSQKHDFDSLLQDFEENLSVNNDLVILEGFRMFYDERLVEKMDVMFYLKMPKDLCYYRRMATFKITDECFQHSLWPLHEEYDRDVLEKYAKNEKFIIIDIEELARSSGEYNSILDENSKKRPDDSVVKPYREKTIDLVLAKVREELEKREIFAEQFPQTKK